MLCGEAAFGAASVRPHHTAYEATPRSSAVAAQPTLKSVAAHPVELRRLWCLVRFPPRRRRRRRRLRVGRRPGLAASAVVARGGAVGPAAAERPAPMRRRRWSRRRRRLGAGGGLGCGGGGLFQRHGGGGSTIAPVDAGFGHAPRAASCSSQRSQVIDQIAEIGTPRSARTRRRDAPGALRRPPRARLLVWLYIAASSSLPLLPWRPPFDDAYPPVPGAARRARARERPTLAGSVPASRNGRR